MALTAEKLHNIAKGEIDLAVLLDDPDIREKLMSLWKGFADSEVARQKANLRKVKHALGFLLCKIILKLATYLCILTCYLALELRFKVQSLKATTEFDFFMSLPSISHRPQIPAKYVQPQSAFHPVR